VADRTIPDQTPELEQGRTAPELDPTDTEQMLQLLATGKYTVGCVARMMGRTRQSIYMRRARDEKFNEAVAKALGAGEMALIDAMVEADEKAWQRWAWLLERNFNRLSATERARVEEIRHRITGERAEDVEPDARFE
jgi:hypothetical protein